MRLIIDANIVIAMFITPGKTAALFFKPSLELFAPEFLREELENNLAMLIERSVLAEIELLKMLTEVFQRICFIQEDHLLSHVPEAERITPDPKDMAYFAAALHLHCPLWSNERKLKKQDLVKVYATHELMELLGIPDRPSDL